MRRRARFVAVGVVALTACGCGGGGGESGLPTMGTPGLPSPTVIGDNLVFAEVLVNGVLGTMVVDTGAPYTFVDPRQFPGSTLPSMGLTKANITFGAHAADFTVDKVPLYSDSTDPLPFGGLVGGNLLRQFSVAFNYRDQNMLLAGMPMPSGVESLGGAVAFHLEGGGNGQLSMHDSTVVPVPATRVPVTVDIEGTPHAFVLDTGASTLLARTAVFNALIADGRPQLAAPNVFTVYGTMKGTLTRARTIKVSDQQVSNVVVLNVGDNLLDQLGQEVGHTVDGLLGGSFLHEFLVTIDYPRGVLHLQRYTQPPASTLDPLRRVGFTLDSDMVGPHAYAVGDVDAGSDAEQQHVASTDEIVSIDGTNIDAIDQFAVGDMLRGVPNSTHDVQFGITVFPANRNATLKLRVEDLLPDPS